MYINVGKNSVNGSVDREQVRKSQENQESPTFKIIHFKTACNQKTCLEHLACINSEDQHKQESYWWEKVIEFYFLFFLQFCYIKTI